MKKLHKIGLVIIAVLTIASCNKENTVISPDSDAITNIDAQKVFVSASTEKVVPPTKVTISEATSTFTLNWQGTETFGLANSTNNTTSKDWGVSDHSGSSATLSGSIIAVTGETTNWLIATNLFSSTTEAIRADIPQNQSYDGNNVANNCLLVARADDASTSSIPSVSFKTMNSFMKFSLEKGSAAPGSSHTYDKMYVQSIEVETLGDEVLAGRFEISKTSGDWYSSYSGTVDGQTSKKVTLDCTVKNTKGEEISSVKDFYVAIAFGTYASGLKVTINVKNEDGDAGKAVKTIASSKTMARNKLYAFEKLIVNPEDAVAPDTYTLITDPASIISGEKYFLAGKNGDKYYLWNGSIATSSSNKDLSTTEYTYNTTTKILTGSSAAEVTLTSTGTVNQFYVKIGDNYLGTSAKTNRRMTLNSTEGSWTFGTDSRGGMTMLYSGYEEYLVSATTTTNVLRNYGASTNGNFGVYLFHKD